MKALVLRSPGQIEIVDVAKPKLSQGEVLVKVLKCGICGSDVRYFHGENPWAKQTLGRHIPNPPNIILGHEFVGIVADVFDPSDAPLIGKRMGVNTFITCGRCSFCRSGRENLCEQTKHLGHGQGWGPREFYFGGMAEYCPAFSSQVYDIPDCITHQQATFFDPMLPSIHAVDVAKPKVLDKVAILGAGPIGLLIAQIVKLRGAVCTFITDITQKNIDVAKEIGVDFAVNVNNAPEVFHELIMRVTNNEGVDLVFNTVGSNKSIEESLTVLKKGGTLVLLAAKEDEIRFPALLLSGEKAIRTSSNNLYADFPKAIELIARGLVRVTPLITHQFGLSQGIEAFAVACNKTETGAIKVIVDCQS